MRLIVDHRDFPFRRETRLARIVDVTLLVLLAALLIHAVRRPGGVRPATAAADEGAIAQQVILTIHADGRWTVAGQLMPPTDAATELARLFADRGVRVLFVEAAPGRPYGDLLDAARRARAAGIETVAFLPPTRD